MSENQQLYYTLITNYGLGAMQNASFLGQKINLTYLAIGDGGGALYELQGNQAALKNEVYRGSINHVYVDPDNKNMMVFECIIPQTSGGYTVREAGLLTEDGTLFAIAKVAETVKPKLEQGAAKELYIRLILELSHADSVAIKVDPSIILSTQKWSLENFTPKDHVQDFLNPHQVTAAQVGAYSKDENKRIAFHQYYAGGQKSFVLKGYGSHQDIGTHSLQIIKPKFKKSIFRFVGQIYMSIEVNDHRASGRIYSELCVEGYRGGGGFYDSGLGIGALLFYNPSYPSNGGVAVTAGFSSIDEVTYINDNQDDITFCIRNTAIMGDDINQNFYVTIGTVNILLIEQEL